MGDDAAYVYSCRCGNIRIAFDDILTSVECGCVDCYDKNLWSCRSGGVAPPAGLERHGQGRCVRVCYIPNNLVFNSAEPPVAFNRLREGSRSTNMVATCCSTILCVDHVSYKCGRLLIFPDFITFVRGRGRVPAPTARIFAMDWDREELAKLDNTIPSCYKDPATGTWKLVGGRDIGGPGTGIKSKVDALTLSPDGVSFQALIADAGYNVANLDIPVNAAAYSLRTRADAPGETAE